MKKAGKSKNLPNVEQGKVSSQPDIKMKKAGKSKNLPNVEQGKVSSQPKKMGSEIEEIFAGKKRKRPEQEKKGKDEKGTKVVAANVKPLDGKKRNSSSKSRSFRGNSSAVVTSQQRKRTTDGLTVFTEEELGIGKPDAGGTALCPFDCDCCF